MTSWKTLYQPSGWSPLVVIVLLLAVPPLIGLPVAIIGLDWAGALGSLLFVLLFGGSAYWVAQRRRKTGVFLAPRHLISRDGTGEDIEIPIQDAVAEMRKVQAGSSLAPMTRHIQLPDSDGIPAQRVLVITHNNEVTELYQVRGMTPPKMLKILDGINAALTVARLECNFPEPARDNNP